MVTIDDIAQALGQVAPLTLAEDWDNVGLLVGEAEAQVSRVMTCLTVTPGSAAEAIDEGASLIVSHHPLPFQPTKRLTTDRVENALLWRLIRAGIAIYSPHTAYDSAARGINQQLAEGFGLSDIRPLSPNADEPTAGTGRVAAADPDMTVSDLVAAAKAFLDLPSVRLVAEPGTPVSKVAFACGSGASMLDDAANAGCDAFVTGEATFHSCLAAQARGISMLLLGHYASERFAVESLAASLQDQFTDLKVWASRDESDPLHTV